MKKISVNPEVLKTVGGQIGTISNGFATQYKKVDDIASNIKNQWSGVDQIAFHDKITGFRDDFDELKATLDSYSKLLINAHIKYSKAQESVKDAATILKKDL